MWIAFLTRHGDTSSRVRAAGTNIIAWIIRSRPSGASVTSGGIKCGRRRIPCIPEVERLLDNLHEPPERENDDEADKAPEDELFPLLAVLFVRGAEDEVLKDAPDEDDEGDGEENGDEDIVDKADNASPVSFERDRINALGGREKRHATEREKKKGSGKARYFFHILVSTAYLIRRNWLRRCGPSIEAEGVRDDVYDSPERYHHDETDNAPEDELVSFFHFFLVTS